MKRLKQAREAFGHTVERLAEELRLPPQTIRDWEIGKRAPTLAELRNLALVYGAGADDLVGDDLIAERPVRSTLMAYREGVDGFWGYLGVLLPRQTAYRWHPISADAADRVAQEIERKDQVAGERRTLTVETLNNRFLWINLATSNGVCLCSNAADWPQANGTALSGPSLDQIDLVRPDHLLPSVLYQVMTEIVAGKEEDASQVSEHLADRARSLLAERASFAASNQLARFLLQARLWMLDGSNHWIAASAESMRKAISDLHLDAGDGLLRLKGPDCDCTRYAIVLDKVAALEVPAGRL